MQEIITQALKLLEDAEDFVLATIIRQLGSAPRETGTRMIISASGKGYGTIGGGQLEAAVIQAAPDVLNSGHSRILAFRLKGAKVEETDMLCGGDVDVYLEPVTAGHHHFASVMSAALDVMGSGERGLLVEPITAGLPDKAGDDLKKMDSFFLSERKTWTGGCESTDLKAFLEDKLTEIIEGNQPVYIPDGDHPQPGCDLFVTPCSALHRVILFGGGHICLHLAKLVKMVGFSLVVADDRHEFVNPERFPDADDLWHTPFETVLKDRKTTSHDYLVIVTRGHQHDATVLYQALKSEAGYVGMIGSRRKREIVYKDLLNKGITQAELDEVYSPIGIKIAAQTPEEIAVSIVAELIDVRGRALKRKKDWEV